ncbi:MAG: nitronate monooxygenase [Desulfotomaculaceae bacterium]|nr:nitronate monooxygenase [Desulfotomaculaceae bacterium]MDD4767243.1 nitronate monooxygenase [Desulfotomaculaceae bacterium]
MKFPSLKIGRLAPRYPIIQGGMAVRVSTAPLAAAVANAGGIGIIAATGMSLDELRNEIRTARRSSKGIIGINIMFAVRHFATLVHTAIEEKIDLIVTGAGFSRDIFKWGKESDTPIVSIVSSAKLAKIAEKLGASAIVAEGMEAGGHLGTCSSIEEILPEITSSVKIPVIAAGGIVDGNGIARAIRLGASGVQMATRFVLSMECAVSDAFKQMYLKASADDVVLISSPVGMPGRALLNPFVKKILDKTVPEPEDCDGCLKECSREYCIIKALENSRLGYVDEGVVFTGQNVYKVNEILPVQKIFDKLVKEVEEEPD